MSTSWEGVSVTESWVFLPPPSPSLQPRRRKGRGLSNRSDVPAEEENNHEEDHCPDEVYICVLLLKTPGGFD